MDCLAFSAALNSDTILAISLRRAVFAALTASIASLVVVIAMIKGALLSHDFFYKSCPCRGFHNLKRSVFIAFSGETGKIHDLLLVT